MEKLSKTSLNYCLSEYLKDLERAGVRDFYKGAANSVSSSPTIRRSKVDAPNASQINPLPPPNSSSVAYEEARRPSAAETPRQEATNIKTSNLQASSVERRQPDDSNVESDERGRRSNLLSVVASDVARCERCSQLVSNRTQTVFGTGDPCAELLFLGEGPGAEEDLQGRPFVGRSGQLLTDMIEKGMGIPRSSVFICNVVRCRPPQNRNPSQEEAQACRPFLDATLEIVRPKFICCLGLIAATNLLNVTTTMAKLRGIVHRYGDASVVCTYHPAYLLRNPSAKRQTWEDLQLLMKEMGLSLPKK